MQFSLSAIPKQKLLIGAAAIVILCGAGVGLFVLHKTPKPVAAVAVHMDEGMTINGRGELKSLATVMKQDVHLKDMVKKLDDVPAAHIFTQQNQTNMMVADVLFRWAEADMTQRGAYGPYIDARVAAFLKKIGSVPASFIPGADIPIKDATNLTQLWFKVFEHYRVILLAQTAGKVIYDGHVKYDQKTDKIEVSGPLGPAFIQDFQSELQKSDNSGEAMRGLLDFIEATKGFDKLTDQEQDLIMSVEVKKPVQAAVPGTAQVNGLPGKEHLPPVTATP